MIEQIRKKCIEANPEIVELKFGCEVEGGFIYSWTNGVLVWLISQLGKGTQMQIPKEDFVKYKIIGRPIRIADVLLAIQENVEHYNEDIIVLVDGFIGFRPSEDRKYHDAILKGNSGCNWNLKDDNLDNQSKETINFIHNLLCK